MIERAVLPILIRALKSFPCVAIIGARQVGKTTLAKELSNRLKKPVLYIDLERPSSLALITREPEEYLSSYAKHCIIIDEVQRLPSVFPLLRSLIDEDRKAARFVLTGSASPELMKGASESLAGRVMYCQLNPIGLHELPSGINLKTHWLRGGFPLPLTMKSTTVRIDWMESFITTYIERDLPLLFDVKFSSVTMRKLWQMLAHTHGNILNAESLGNSLDITGTTLKRYLDFLEAAFIINRLPPFFINLGKRLVKMPKVYLNDTGILHFLLNIQTEKDLLNHPNLGASWEGYVINQIRYAKENRLDAFYYRTHAGAECDLVLAKGDDVKAAIEIKYGKSSAVSKGFYHSIADLKSKNNFIITPLESDFLSKEGVRRVSLEIFLKKYLPKLK
ncbi:MAG: ATP-binding protein [Cyclobacteriaceae bacterium]|nr:ATP-binding protein [Cyclobacteriaceae bacterium]